MTLLQFHGSNQSRLHNNSCSEYPLVTDWGRCRYVPAKFTRSDTTTVIEPLTFAQCANCEVIGIMPAGYGAAVFIVDYPMNGDSK